MTENYFCELNSINVNDKTERKTGLHIFRGLGLGER